MSFIELIKQPWPWYVAGPIIGLMVPTLLIFGNKTFGISSSLRHVCAACMPAKIPFFQYDWKKELWNLFFVFGIFLGGILTAMFLKTEQPIVVDPSLVEELSGYGITAIDGLVPEQLFSWDALGTTRGLIMMVFGGFLVGFGARYAGGCTSGHAIMGISSLQWPSLVATIFFMLGGFFMTHVLLAPLMKLVGF
jgi:uncharacterized membrane protein YedE/YeeE